MLGSPANKVCDCRDAMPVAVNSETTTTTVVLNNDLIKRTNLSCCCRNSANKYS